MELRQSWYVCVAFMLCVALIMVPQLAMASSITNASPMSNALCIAATWLTGASARARATIAVAILGIGALLGKISWGMAMIVGVGIAVVFGATALVQLLGGTVGVIGVGTTNCT
jgi:type IV secretion system protein VirB2